MIVDYIMNFMYASEFPSEISLSVKRWPRDKLIRPAYRNQVDI